MACSVKHVSHIFTKQLAIVQVGANSGLLHSLNQVSVHCTATMAGNLPAGSAVQQAVEEFMPNRPSPSILG